MRRSWIALLLVFAACRQEAPVREEKAPPKPSVSNVTTSVEPIAKGGTYAGAMDWFRSTPGFDFAIEDGGIHATGTLTRATVGAETVVFNAEGGVWRAATGPRGVTWERNDGVAWKAVPAPEWGTRLYQRITVAFDPQKKEQTAQLAASDATSHTYRFTNANSGETHEVQVSRANDHVMRVAIGDAMKLAITNGRD